MKKAITLSAATLALLVAGASGASAVSAASVNDGHWTSKGTIGFTPNSKAQNITNPEVPELTHPGGSAGTLAIDYVPELDFGKPQISSKTETYYAKADINAFKGTAVGAFVEMHDLRGLGTGNNTQLTVTQIKGFNNDKGDLAKADLSFSAGQAANAGGGDYTPTAPRSFTLTPNTAQLVMSTNGISGQFLTSYGKASDYTENETGGPISLSIPSGSALAVDFSTTLEWDLEIAP